MQLFPMTLFISDSATDVSAEGLSYETGLHLNSVKMLLGGATIHVAGDFLNTIQRVNEHYAGKITLLTGEPIDLGGNEDISLDMNDI